MLRLKFNAAVKASEYQDKNGNTKARWENVGSVMVDEKNNSFLVLKRTFNPAGVPNPDNRDSVIVYFFTPKDERDNAQGGGRSNQAQAQSRDYSRRDSAAKRNDPGFGFGDAYEGDGADMPF